MPWEAAASAEAAHELLTDEGARERHVRSLAERARALTWDAAAAAMVEIYREAALAPVRDSATLSRDLVKREARLSVQHELEVAQLVGEREHAKADVRRAQRRGRVRAEPDRSPRRAARTASSARCSRSARGLCSAVRSLRPWQVFSSPCELFCVRSGACCGGRAERRVGLRGHPLAIP